MVLHFDLFCVFFFYILYSVPALVAFPLTCKGIMVCVRVGVRPRLYASGSTMSSSPADSSSFFSSVLARELRLLWAPM